MIDPEARYLKTHEWAKLESDDEYTVGLSSYAIEQLGDIVFMELPEVGDVVEQGMLSGWSSRSRPLLIYAPLSGEVVDVNDAVPDSPDMLKDDPYEEGWLIKIHASSPKELEKLLDAKAYKQFLETEAE